MQITLPDGSQRSYGEKVSVAEVAASIGAGLAKAALAGKVDGTLVDVSHTLTRDAKLEIITLKSPEALEVIRHSTAHVLAMAVQKLWPGTQVTIGPVIENGFYYDFAFPSGVKIGEGDLAAIEKEMQAIVKAGHVVTREVWPKDKAVATFKSMGEHFKVEIIEDLPSGEPISVYTMGGWFDLCRGPHVPSTAKLGAFRLTSLAGSYWRGNEKNPPLTRIYGTAWGNQADLDAYITRLEEARKRDHRVLGKQLGLFSFQKEAAASPFFHPRGQVLFNNLVKFMRRINTEYGFEEVGTPLIMNVDMWHKSGHYDNYRENMYFTEVDELQAAVKPMNCPGHCLIYASDRRSYRQLPLRLSEFGRVHRHERSGVTHGLMRVRTFVQDDAHVFCMPEQIETEISRILELINKTYIGLGFTVYRVELSTRPEKSIGSDEIWQKAESALENVLKNRQVNYKLNPGDGAFYGPKIDFHLIDSIGRSWQCGTVQLDFSMPSRFGLEFQGADDKPHTPVMLHRAVLGSVERFMGIFIEHYAGHFPLWAAPLQIRVINVTEGQGDYAAAVCKTLKEKGLRVDLDDRREKLGYKIREAQLEKIPYMLILGEKEREAGLVTARFHDGTNLESQTLDSFVGHLQKQCGDLWGL